MNRISPVYTAPNHREAVAEIDRLHDLFKSLFRRSLSVDLFFYSAGPIRGGEYGISLYWEEDSAKDARWVQENVKRAE